MNRRFSLQTLFVAAAFIMFPIGVFAQTLSLAPSTGSVAVGGNGNFNIVVNNPGSNSGVALRMTINPSIMTFADFEPNSGFTLTTGCATGSANFDDDEICFDGAAGSAFTNGQVLATVTIHGEALGSQAMTFASGTEFSDGVTSTPFTGNVGTFTVAATGTLPETGLIDEQPLLFAGLVLLGLAILVNRVPLLREYSFLFLSKQEQQAIVKQKQVKSLQRRNAEFDKERDAFEAGFASKSKD